MPGASLEPQLLQYGLPCEIKELHREHGNISMLRKRPGESSDQSQPIGTNDQKPRSGFRPNAGPRKPSRDMIPPAP